MLPSLCFWVNGCRAAVDDANLESGRAVIAQTIQPASQAQPVHRCATHRPQSRARLRNNLLGNAYALTPSYSAAANQPLCAGAQISDQRPSTHGARPSPRRCTPHAGGRSGCPAVLRSGRAAVHLPSGSARIRAGLCMARRPAYARRIAAPSSGRQAGCPCLSHAPRPGAWGRLTFLFQHAPVPPVVTAPTTAWPPASTVTCSTRTTCLPACPRSRAQCLGSCRVKTFISFADRRQYLGIQSRGIVAELPRDVAGKRRLTRTSPCAEQERKLRRGSRTCP